ncbi:MAG: glutathione S-transferase N-terminal domain-containing protein [Gammaproteobacteria bacterium]|nr:glutathione S-transferase N-terminal domain-containing protein [Gammaproteobacteria bacterium]
MVTVATRRSIMTLYSAADCARSHRVRMVLKEKDITVDVVDVDLNNKPADLYDVNQTGNLPTLVDRDLVLPESRLIMEYLDERYPHPPLLPVDPVSRAKCRLVIHHIEEQWYTRLDELIDGTPSQVEKARKYLAENITQMARLFDDHRSYFLGEEMTLVDCFALPILWRLDYYRVELPKDAKTIMQYATRVFERPSFRASLTETERNLRS